MASISRSSGHIFSVGSSHSGEKEMMRLETERLQRLPLDVLTYLIGKRAKDLQADMYPDTGESGEAYDVELACSFE